MVVNLDVVDVYTS